MILEYENNKIKFESHEYFLYLEDVINLSDELNFEIVDIYGNYEMDPFIEDSDELIIIGKKKMSDNNKFNIQSPFSHRGDQPNAIKTSQRGK